MTSNSRLCNPRDSLSSRLSCNEVVDGNNLRDDNMKGTSSLRSRRSSNLTPKQLYPQPSIQQGRQRPGSVNMLRSPSLLIHDFSTTEDDEAHAIRGRILDAMETDVTGSSTSTTPTSASVRRPDIPSSLPGHPLRAPLLVDLARQTTLPNTAVTRLPLLPSDPASDNLHYAPIRSNSPTIIQQASPSRTPINTLRSIQEFHTSANARTSNWWFHPKQNIEPLLEDRDKGDETETAEQKLRKRCMQPSWPLAIPVHFTIVCG
jgi:hypothetical protein